jgi:hypothetical protein
MPASLPTSAIQSGELPHYEHPPLVEVRLGARWLFDARVEHAVVGALVERLGPSWEYSSPVPPVIEKLPPSGSSPAATFHSVLRDQRLEIGSEGLSFTWDGRNGNIYPHYESVRDGFVMALDAWHDALTTLGVDLPVVTGWHLAYLNCMPRGTVWNSMADCSFLRLLAPLPAGLPKLERCEARWDFALDRCDARLTCDLRTTTGSLRDPQPCLWLRLSCQGGVTSDSGSLLEGLDFGREVIVNTFRQLMSPAANAYWQLVRGR